MNEETINKLVDWKKETKPDTVFTFTVDKCEGCENQTEKPLLTESDVPKIGCAKYLQPERQHTRIGGCAMDTRKAEKAKDDFKLNPLKASKRGVK